MKFMPNKPEAISRAPICNGIKRLLKVPLKQKYRKEYHDGTVNVKQINIRIHYSFEPISLIILQHSKDCSAMLIEF